MNVQTNFYFSFIIPTHLQRGTLRDCLRSCAEQNYPQDRFEVIVVSNFEDSEVKKIVAEFPERFSYTISERLGVNSARNHGAQMAKGHFMVFLDDDCLLPDSGWLQRLSHLIQRHPHFAAWGGGYLSHENSSWLSRGHNHLVGLWLEKGRLTFKDPDVRPNQFLAGGNVCYGREIFENGLWFEESLIQGGDETEFHSRLIRQGYQLGFSHQLNVFHRPSSKLRFALRRAWNHGRAAAQFALSSPHQTFKAGINSSKALIRAFRNDPLAMGILPIHYIFYCGGFFNAHLQKLGTKIFPTSEAHALKSEQRHTTPLEHNKSALP